MEDLVRENIRYEITSAQAAKIAHYFGADQEIEDHQICEFLDQIIDEL